EFGVTQVVILFAFLNDVTILELVSFAWAGFGGAFGPAVILSLYWKKITRTGALAGMIVGAIIVGVWGNIPALSEPVYEIIPAFILNLIVTIIVSNKTYEDNPEIEKEFKDVLSELDN